MPPHQTHQNGLSADLFVPVVDRDGNSVPFPNRPDNGYGYQVAFDSNGENATWSLDYANLGELLYQLHVAAKNRGSGLALVVSQRELRARLFATARGRWLKTSSCRGRGAGPGRGYRDARAGVDPHQRRSCKEHQGSNHRGGRAPGVEESMRLAHHGAGYKVMLALKVGQPSSEPEAACKSSDKTYP
jgi:hypothetical protein